MLRIKIIEFDEFLDLYKDTKIRLEFNNSFTNFEYSEGSFSYSFKIPNNQKNARIFNYPNYPENINKNQKKYEIDFDVNECYFFTGLLKIKKATKIDIECSINVGYGNWGQKVRDDKTLTEIDFGRYDFGQGEINGENSIAYTGQNPPIEAIPQAGNDIFNVYISWFHENTLLTSIYVPPSSNFFTKLDELITNVNNNVQNYIITRSGQYLSVDVTNSINIDFFFLKVTWDEQAAPSGMNQYEYYKEVTTQQLTPFFIGNDFVFPTIKNNLFYDKDKNTPFLSNPLVNNFNPFFQNQLNNNRSTLTPMLFLKTIIQKLFNLGDYQIEGDFLQDTELLNLVIYNTYSIDKQHPFLSTGEVLNVHQSGFDYKNHLPEMSVKEFLNNITKYFCIDIFFNTKDKKVKINLKKNMLNDLPDADWSDKIMIFEVEIDEKKNYELGYPKALDEFNFFSRVKTNVTEFETTDQIELNGSTLRVENGITTDNHIGNSEMFEIGLDNTFPLQLLFWRGLINGVPTATPLANTQDKYSLLWNTDKGLYNVFWKDFISFLQNCKYIPTQSVYLSLHELINIDLQKKKKINGNDYLIQKLSIELENTPNSITKPAQIDFIKIPADILYKVKVYSIGNGVKFNGISHFMQIPYTPALDFEFSDDVSVSVWLKPFSNLGNTNGGINRFTPFGSATGISFDISNNFYSILIYGQGNALMKYVSFSGARTAGTLRHLVFVKDGQNAANYKIYENGVLLATDMTANGAFTTSIKSNKPYIIGRDYVNATLQAEIYDLKFFKQALTPAEIDILFVKKGEVVPPTALSNLVADYRLEEKSGFIVADSSPNANTANLENYTLGQVMLGAGNHRIQENGNGIL